jgi:hypothetical protein
VTYNAHEDVYLLETGRKVKRLEILVYGAPPVSLPFQWAVMAAPATPLTMDERLEIACWLSSGLTAWATREDAQVDAAEANVGPRLIVLKQRVGAPA